MVVREYAEQLAKDIHGDSALSFDPLTILAIIQAIAAIVSLWKNCRPSDDFSAEGVREYLVSGGPFLRRIRSIKMQRAIRSSLTEKQVELLGPTDVFVYHLIKSAEKHQAFFDAAYLEATK